jgi:hypothetical protein
MDGETMRWDLLDKSVLKWSKPALILFLWSLSLSCRSESRPPSIVSSEGSTIDKKQEAQVRTVAVESSEREKKEKMMNKFSLLPYGQPFSNVQLNSVAFSVLGELKTLAKKVASVSIPNAYSPTYKPEIQWLLASAEHKIIAVGESHYWLIELDKYKSIAFCPIEENILVSFLQDGRYLYNDGGGLSLRKAEPQLDTKSGKDIIDAFVESMDRASVPYALFPMEDEYVILIQNLSQPDDDSFKEAVISRKPYVGQMQSLKWDVRYQQYSARSPFLSDGTLAVFLPDGLRLINLDGKEVGHIKAELMPGMLSADNKDTIWGIKDAPDKMKLLGFSRDGKNVVDVDIPAKGPTQPPVTLEDGRILIVTKTKLVCIKEGKMLWEKVLPVYTRKLDPDEQPDARPNDSFRGGQDPLVTASSNGKILVKHGHTLMMLEDGPKEKWQITAPDNKWITSNAVITADGKVCFACTNEIYCLSK